MPSRVQPFKFFALPLTAVLKQICKTRADSTTQNRARFRDVDCVPIGTGIFAARRLDDFGDPDQVYALVKACSYASLP